MWTFQPFHIYSSISEMALPHIFPLNSFSLFYPYIFLWGWTFSWMPRSFQMCIPSPEHWYWLRLPQKSLPFARQSSSSVQGWECMKTSPPHLSDIPSHTSGQLAPLAGLFWKGQEISKPWGCRNRCAAEMQRMEKSFCNCLTEHQGHRGHFAGI